MYSECENCPTCQSQKAVVYWGKNRNGTRRFKCRACVKTFTPKPGTNRISPEKERLIQSLLEERMSIEAIARVARCAKRTAYNILKKRSSESTPPTSST
jgi:transposase-like protein